jgi:thiol-disulfide isomerase/thioredoxin
MTGAWVVVAVLVVATAFGVWRQRTSGRITDAASGRSEQVVVVATADDLPVEIESDIRDAPVKPLLEALDGRLGAKATMVQFSSAFCQPCRATRRILEEVAVMVPGVSHVEIDAEDNLDLVRALDIRRTPTVLFLDAQGTVRKHASGLPRKADVIAALGDLIPATGTGSGAQDFAI